MIDELISGSFSKLGLNYAYLTHSAGKSRTESVYMALFADYYIFENGFGLGYGVTYGANTGNANKHYPLQGVGNLTTTIPAESTSNLVSYNIRLGYYISRCTYDASLYIGTGFRIKDYASISTNTPAVGEIIANYIPIELRGDMRVNPRFCV